MVRVHDAYDDRRDDTHISIRRALVSPYENQAEDERPAEQKARSKRKATEPESGEAEQFHLCGHRKGALRKC